MKAFAVSAFALVLFAATCSAASIDNRGLLDGALKNALEGLRPKVKDLAINDTSINIDKPELQVNATIKNGLVEGLDKFVTRRLTTTLLPLRLTNLTLTWDKVKITGVYDLFACLNFPTLPDVTKIFGAGKFKIQFHGIFFTIAADFVFENGHFKIPKNGLHGCDVSLKESKVELDNLLGGGEKGDILNKYISFFIPEFINDHKQTIFDVAREPIIEMINDYLAGNSNKL
ncbi:UNVERIFIED_CONTAM: hypothetical protein PYX00_002988 [Menopon gallinae]|uniref:Uncharacterized protein n=1 Tax=Menopon gallinae TaxID=328185 RepID=A0AAW2HZG5_9NEOP